MGEVRYLAEITGDRPPFYWKLIRKQEKGAPMTLSEHTGSATTFEEAAFAAQQAAHEAHADWMHLRTKEEIVVLLTDDTVTRPHGLDLPVAEKNESPIPDWLPVTKEQLRKFAG